MLENKALPLLPKQRRLLFYGNHGPILIQARTTGSSVNPRVSYRVDGDNNLKRDALTSTEWSCVIMVLQEPAVCQP